MVGDTTTAARPYAEAAFEHAKEKGTVDAWTDALVLLAGIGGHETVRSQIANPKVTDEQVRDMIIDIAGDRIGEGPRNLVRLLAANDRLETLGEIGRLFGDLAKAHKGVRQVLIRTAQPLAPDQEQALAEALKKRFGTQVDVSVENDETLLGGVEIRAGDLVIDGSVRGRLTQLAAQLNV